MFCNYCGKPNPDDARFCSACGKAIATASAAPPRASLATPPVPSPSQPPPPVASTPQPSAPSLLLHDRVLTGHRFPVYSMAFRPDGRRIASGSLDRTARIWDLEGGREIASFPGTLPVTSLDFSADGRMLAIASSEATDPASSISLWSAERPRELRSLAGHKGRCMCVRFHPDGRLLASTEGGMKIDIWDLASGRIVRTLEQGLLRSKAFGGAFRCSLAFSPNGRHLASRSWPVTIWDVYQGTEVMTLSSSVKPGATPVFIGFFPDGQQLVEAREDGSIRVWNVYRDEIASEIGPEKDASGRTPVIQAVALGRDARHLAVASYSSAREPKYAVTLWDLPASRRVATFALQDGSAALAFSPDGQWLALTDTTYGGGQASGYILFQSVAQLT